MACKNRCSSNPNHLWRQGPKWCQLHSESSKSPNERNTGNSVPCLFTASCGNFLLILSWQKVPHLHSHLLGFPYIWPLCEVFPDWPGEAWTPYRLFTPADTQLSPSSSITCCFFRLISLSILWSVPTFHWWLVILTLSSWTWEEH